MGNAVSAGVAGVLAMLDMLVGMLAGMPAGVVDGESGGSGWPGGGIESPASAAYGPTCGAIDDGVVCWGMAAIAGGVSGAAAAAIDGGGVLP